MARALLTLLAGILLAVLLAAAIAGDSALLGVLGPVLVTTGLGAAVMLVVAWRARIRERAQQLEDEGAASGEAPDAAGTADAAGTTDTDHSDDPLRVTDEDIHRG